MTGPLDLVGINTDFLAQQLLKEITATKVKVFHNPKGNKNNRIVYSKPMALWDIRQKARMDAHRLRGDYPAEQLEQTIRLEDIVKDLEQAEEGLED